MKTITFAAIKGGVGKTTLIFNYGEWLASLGKRVLFFDLDHQCNLTQTYDIYDNENTVANIFQGDGKINIKKINDYISIVPGSMQLDKIERDIENKSFKDMLMLLWFKNHRDELLQYDYILIDTHPDFSTATRNAIVVSDNVLSPITPSEHGYTAKFNLSSRMQQFHDETLNYDTMESYVHAKLMFIANRVKHNTNSSRNLLKAIADEKDVIAIIPEKELFNRSTLDKKSLAMMQQDPKLYQRQKAFFDNIDQIWKHITQQL